MTKRFFISGIATLIALVFGGGAAVAQTVPAGWTTKDVGAVGAIGSGSGTMAAMSLTGDGADIWGTADAFHFAYRPLTDDGSIITQVTSVQNVNGWSKAGVMMRESLAAGSRHALMLVSAGKGLAFQRRLATNGASTSTPAGTGTAPSFVKLTRSGNLFTASTSVDGVTWTAVGTETIPMATTIYVGVAVTSHVKGVLATASFASTKVETTIVDPPPALRVLHWNVHHGGIGSDNVYDPARIAKWIAQINPDVASLNEVDDQAHVTAILKALKTITGVTYSAQFSGLGNLVISKLAVVATSRCVYPDGRRYAAHMGVLVNGRPLNIWSTHLTVDDAAARLAEVKSLQVCALNWPEARILAGDFNMQQGSPEYQQAVIGYTDAWLTAKKAGTATNYPGNCDGCTRNSRIDYVFTSNGASFLVLKSAQVFDTRDAKGVTPSDHKPLLVVYEVK